jgi:error-prone DNA polymerase
MSSLPRNAPQSFYDLVVQVALIRPGPIVGNMVNPYVKRRQGREPVSYPHPSLEPILKRTLGVPLFQEQLLRMAMVCANFTGGEAEQLRRALTHKRSQELMQEIETKLRQGMTESRIDTHAQDEIVMSITSFARYGFPESHAASFALIAYASAYLKCHYLPAFTAALLNNQPMGFYHPSTLVKDAQRHGLKIRPVDVSASDWPCTLEPTHDGAYPFTLRVGLNQVRSLRSDSAQAIIRARAGRPFSSIDDLAGRVPELRKDELVRLAQIGALNQVGQTDQTDQRGTSALQRRSALWQVERAMQSVGPLLSSLEEEDAACPLQPMTQKDRLVADLHGTGMTLGPHPMAYFRPDLIRMKVQRATDLNNLPSGERVRVAGFVIARQRPGTAKGFIFVSLEDETGIANLIIHPRLGDEDRIVMTRESCLLVEGVLQNQDGVVAVKVKRIRALKMSNVEIPSHDFH